MGFDEAMYLSQNPDVFEAVKNRSFSSGWQHYIFYGYDEDRAGVLPEVHAAIKKIMDDDKPFPPEKLRKRVHGDEELSVFAKTGQLISFDIRSAVDSLIELNQPHQILDFGCGCGRILRYFHKFSDQSDFYGTDIDEEAITWCKQNLAQIGGFVHNQELPPLPFADQFFDFIYSISVFTHLPEDMQFAWLEELQRVVKPGGYLLLTIHGEDLFKTSSKETNQQFREKGFYYSISTGTEGLPSFYQTTFHTKDYIYKHWGRFFEIKEIIKKGVGNHQDLVICKA